jgi:DNA-directed RNA polymerase specialized sigma24 family protein
MAAKMGEASAPHGEARCVRADIGFGSAAQEMPRKPLTPVPLLPTMRAPCPGFAHEYRAHHQQLLRLAALLTGDQRVAEAVVADAFVALHRAWKAVGSGERSRRYLLRLVIVRSRRANRRSAGHQHPGVMTSCVTGATQSSGPTSTVMLALRALPQQQREAVALTYYLDLSEDQAAAVMGVRKAALRRLLAQGLTRLGPTLSSSS